MKTISIISALAAFTVLLAGAGPALSQISLDAGDQALPAALQDRATVAAARLVAGSAYLAEPDASGSLGPPLLLAEWRFDEGGNVLEQASYDRGGALVHRIAYIYEAGFLVETFNEGIRGTGAFTTTMRYDGGNRLVSSESVSEAGVPIIRTTYGYNDRGEMTELVTDTPVKGASRRVSMSYDGEGRITETVVSDAQGAVSGRTINSYDRDGNLLAQSSYTEEGTPISTTRNRYDSEGRLVRTEVLNTAGEIVRIMSHGYDHEDRLAESSSSTPSAGTSSRTTFEYGSRGLPTRVDTFDKRGRLASRITYRYDYADKDGSPDPRRE